MFSKKAKIELKRSKAFLKNRCQNIFTYLLRDQ